MPLTLDEHRTNVQRALGNRGYDDPRLDGWINFGYLDLAGAVKFEILTSVAAIPSVSGQDYLDVPEGTMGIELVKDVSASGKLLGKLDHAEFMRFPSASGNPVRWTWIGSQIRFRPIPNSVRNYQVLLISPPAELSADDDESIFPAIWDYAIHLLSTHIALLDLGQEARSAVWLARAISYIQSRATEQDLSLDNLNARLASMANVSK